MKKTYAALALAMLMSSSGFAQSIKIPDRIEKLAAKANDTVNITLDGPLLQLAGMFLNGNNSDEAQAKNVISKLKGIHVRSFEFSKDGEYSEADVESLRSQLRSGWARVIETREGKEHVEVFIKQEKGELGGLVILSAEPRELTIVNIDGPIDLRKLASLAGKFGIPNIPTAASVARPAAEAKAASTAKDAAE